MKRITRYALIAGMLLLTACNDWLNVTSSNQISDERLFSTRTGFLEALSGVYIDMASASNYGMNASWYVLDLASMPYASTVSDYYTDLQDHKFSTSRVAPLIRSIWQGGYHVIANANKILAELQEHPDVVSDALERDLIRGELLAIRAYVHFDLMNAFGAVSWTGDNASLLTIPYVRTYSKDPEIQRSYAATLELLYADLDEAIRLLEKDPVRGEVSEDFLAGPNVDGYWNNRNKHLNYLAAKALKTRVLVREDRWDEAAALAQEVIDESFACGLVSWFDADEMVKKTASNQVDWTMSTEQIFCLEATDMYTNTGLHFKSTTTSTDVSIQLDKTAVENWLFNPAFPGDLSPVEDVRGPSLMLSYGLSGYAINKYYTSTDYPAQYRNRIPMIRLPELYFLLAEYALRKGDEAGFDAAVSEVRMHRGITSPYTPAFNRMQGLVEEWIKEFVGEGRFFSFIKRYMYWYRSTQEHAIWINVTHVERFEGLVLPYPVEEEAYGRKQEL